MRHSETISHIQKIVAALAEKYGVQRIYLFGSYAKGSMTADSDIDLRIDKGNVRGLEIAALLLELEDALGLPVDLVTSNSLDQSFLASIAENEILLYEAQ